MESNETASEFRVGGTSRWEPSFPHCDFGCLFQLGHEAIIFLARPISVPDPQKIAWMHSHPSLRPVGQLLNLATQFSRSEEHTSELQSLMRISYAVFCLQKT